MSRELTRRQNNERSPDGWQNGTIPISLASQHEDRGISEGQRRQMRVQGGERMGQTRSKRDLRSERKIKVEQDKKEES